MDKKNKLRLRIENNNDIANKTRIIDIDSGKYLPLCQVLNIEIEAESSLATVTFEVKGIEIDIKQPHYTKRQETEDPSLSDDKRDKVLSDINNTEMLSSEAEAELEELLDKPKEE